MQPRHWAYSALPFLGSTTPQKKQEADPANPTSCSILLFQMLLSKTDKKKRVMRIELTCSAWKADILPLNYTRILNQEGFEPPTHGLEGRCSIQLSY